MSTEPDTLPDPVSTFRRDTLNIVSVEVLFFGFYVCLFFVTMYTVWNMPVKAAGKTTRLVQSVLLVVLFVLSALHVGLDWWYPAQILQNDGASPLLVLDFLADLPVFFLIIEGLTLAFNTMITDSISVWRCWVLYDRKLRVAVFPVLCIAVSLVMAIVALIARIQFTFSLQRRPSNLTSGFPRWEHLLTIYFATSLGATVYTTSLIIYKIIKAHIQLAKATQVPFSSAKICIMIVESALLYTVSHVVTLVLLVQVSPVFNFSQDILAQMAGISPTLLILRVCIARSSDTTHFQDGDEAASTAFYSAGSSSARTEDFRRTYNFERNKI